MSGPVGPITQAAVPMPSHPKWPGAAAGCFTTAAQVRLREMAAFPVFAPIESGASQRSARRRQISVPTAGARSPGAVRLSWPRAIPGSRLPATALLLALAIIPSPCPPSVPTVIPPGAPPRHGDRPVISSVFLPVPDWRGGPRARWWRLHPRSALLPPRYRLRKEACPCSIGLVPQTKALIAETRAQGQLAPKLELTDPRHFSPPPYWCSPTAAARGRSSSPSPPYPRLGALFGPRWSGWHGGRDAEVIERGVGMGRRGGRRAAPFFSIPLTLPLPALGPVHATGRRRGRDVSSPRRSVEVPSKRKNPNFRQGGGVSPQAQNRGGAPPLPPSPRAPGRRKVRGRWLPPDTNVFHAPALPRTKKRGPAPCAPAPSWKTIAFPRSGTALCTS